MEIYPKKNEDSTIKVEKYFKSQSNTIPITNEKITIISDTKFLSRNINFPKIEYPGILEITVIGSQSMSFGTKIKIDKMGLMEKSLRNIKSNITYFGFIEDLNLNNEKNDNLKFIGRFFRIYFNTKNLNYYLRDLGNCLGTYVKVKESIILKNEDMINVGDTFLIFHFENDKSKNNSNNDIINIQITELNKNNESQNREFSFNSSKKIIRIGRKKYNNDIELNDHLVSKVNCNIQYDEKNGWKIKDGNEIISENGESKITNSTNGTWILAIDDFLIYENMIFKSNLNLFRCNFIKQN